MLVVSHGTAILPASAIVTAAVMLQPPPST
jgi:hypothetical protein